MGIEPTRPFVWTSVFKTDAYYLFRHGAILNNMKPLCTPAGIRTLDPMFKRHLL